MVRDERDQVSEKAAKEVLERCGNQCEFCFTFGVQIHHVKYRSRAPRDPLLHEPINLAGLCQECHDRTHDGDPALARFRTHSWQEIGKTEADEKE